MILSNMENKMKKKLLSNEIVFFKEYLIEMSSNLINLHKLKLYEGLTNNYSVIFNELTDIKNKLDKYPDYTNRLSNQVVQIRQDLIKYSNHIAPLDIRLILHLFLDSNWNKYFNYSDMTRLHLMTRMFNPISVWDSYCHNNIVEYTNQTPKRTAYNRDVINTITEDNIKTTSLNISDINAFPMFIKSLSEMIMKDKKKNKNERKNHFNYEELSKFFTFDNNVIFTKNENINSLVEEKTGFNLMIKINDRIIMIQGFAKDDMLDLYKTNNLVKEKYTNIEQFIKNDINTIPDSFKDNYKNTLNIRDILIHRPEEYCSIIKKRYNDYKSLRNKTLTVIIDDFLLASKYRKLEIIITLLCGDTNDCKLSYLLYDILRMKDKKDISIEIYNSLPTIFKIKLDETENSISEEEESLIKNHIGELSYERRINMMNTTHLVKDKAIEKLKALKTNFQGDSKAQSWLDGLLKIPFNSYCENRLMNFKKNFLTKIDEPITSCEQIKNYINKKYKETDEIYQDWKNFTKEKSEYLKLVNNRLDEAVYGHKEAKLQLERLFAQWINGETKGAVIGLLGPPGTGKTSLAKNGLSKCLIDDNNKPRPFAFLPIGGSVNGSTLVGHNYTYVGATWGRIADILMTTNCMNPIIFIDEVDKISNTEYGKEITAVLTHLTDSTQNDSFEDKYFSGIPLDLSKALIVFSFNDINLLDPILRDRITIIETKPYTLQEKIHIIQEYMLPDVLKDVGFDKNEIIFSSEIITYLIDTYTNEAGVRKIKEKIVEIVRDINLMCIHDTNITLPFIVSKEYIDIIFKNKPKMRINMIHKTPDVGLVNGLYATTTGVGGLTVIQVMKYPSEKMLDLTLTGQQGEVMKESVEYALRIAYSLLTDEEKDKILEESKNKKNFGLLVHTPEAATKKDGPSAGAAISLAIYSILTGKKINNTIAMTGEIDLCKNIRAIGGVYAKLSGAKAAGVKLALIPKENLDDLTILRNDNISPEDDSFKVELIETFEDVIKYSII